RGFVHHRDHPAGRGGRSRLKERIGLQSSSSKTKTANRGGNMSKTVLVTGATAGFGEATARRFSKAGWNVIITGRRADRLDKLRQELGAERVHASIFDIRDTGAIDAALAALPERFHDIDVLVNNAGLALGTAPAFDADLEQ